MSTIQKILLSFLLVIFIFIGFILALVGAYNSLTQRDARAIEQWTNFQRVYESRFLTIQEISKRLSQISSDVEKLSGTNVNLINYAESRTIDAKVEALIELELSLRQLLAEIKAAPILIKDQPISRLIKTLQDQEESLIQAQIIYNEAVLNYNKAVRTPPYTILSFYFKFAFKPLLPVLWEIK